jgi:two-component system nitrate/nitrite response regulator NarL
MSTNVCLVCPNDISREGLSHILQSAGFEVLGSFESLECIDTSFPVSDSLFLIDCVDPLEQAASMDSIRSRFPSAKVIILSEQFDLKSMIECFNHGAQGYIIRSVKSARLLAALGLAAVGEKVIPSDFVEALGGQIFDYTTPSSAESDIEEANLSPRELDVLCCLMAGYSNKVIARKLDVCEATVKVHVKSILRKLDVRNRTQAAIWANSRHLSEGYLVS